jgi:hypothetical protein
MATGSGARQVERPHSRPLQWPMQWLLLTEHSAAFSTAVGRRADLPWLGPNRQVVTQLGHPAALLSSSAALRGAAPGETQINIAVIAAALDRS